MAVSRNLEGKVPVVDDVLSSHEQEIYPTTSLDENCRELEFQTELNYYVYLRKTYLALKLKFVNGCGYETYHATENKKEQAKADDETAAAEEKQEAPVPLVTNVNNIFHWILSSVEVYINNQQIYNSNTLYAHKSLQYQQLQGGHLWVQGSFALRGVRQWKFYGRNYGSAFAWTFFTRRLDLLSRPDSFMLYGKLGVDFFFTSELLYPNV